MPVIGRNSMILAQHNKTAEVRPYTPQYEPLEVPLVDAAIAWDCPRSGKVVILVIRNGLYVPTMKTNLLPPFISREKGVVVNGVPKVQVDSPTQEDHSIYFLETQLRIPLHLWEHSHTFLLVSL